MIGFFQRYILHNLGLKILSVLLATGLWLLISRDEEPAEVALRAPIVFQHVPAQLRTSRRSAKPPLVLMRPFQRQCPVVIGI